MQVTGNVRKTRALKGEAESRGKSNCTAGPMFSSGCLIWSVHLRGFWGGAKGARGWRWWGGGAFCLCWQEYSRISVELSTSAVSSAAVALLTRTPSYPSEGKWKAPRVAEKMVCLLPEVLTGLWCVEAFPPSSMALFLKYSVVSQPCNNKHGCFKRSHIMLSFTSCFKTVKVMRKVHPLLC